MPSPPANQIPSHHHLTPTQPRPSCSQPATSTGAINPWLSANHSLGNCSPPLLAKRPLGNAEVPPAAWPPHSCCRGLEAGVPPSLVGGRGQDTLGLLALWEGAWYSQWVWLERPDLPGLSHRRRDYRAEIDSLQRRLSSRATRRRCPPFWYFVWVMASTSCFIFLLVSPMEMTD